MAARNLEPVYETVIESDDEAEWLKARCSGIGASEIAILLGESEWSSSLDLYYSKRDQLPLEDERNEDEWLFWGRELEDSIRKVLCKRAGVELTQTNTLLRSTLYPWAIATPDGLTVEIEPVETKNIAWGYKPEEWAERIPEKYYIQCQHQMLVTGAKRCLFGALLWGSRLIWEWVPRDEQMIARIIAAGKRFWAHVESGNPPLPDGHPNARKLLASRAVNDSAVELFDYEISDFLQEYEHSNAKLKEIRDEERKVKKRCDAAANAVAQHMGAHRSAYTATGWTFSWEKTSRNGYTVEPKEFEQLKIKAPKA